MLHYLISNKCKKIRRKYKCDRKASKHQMKVTGIIAEYNPFHNGHKYHIEKAKELTGADYVIVVMSGNFTQRGIPAFTDKYTRTRMALSCGADLVLELPLYYAAGSAEYFATGAVSLLDRLGVVDSLCFGSECGNIDALMHVASVLYNEPDSYKKLLQDALKSGQNYPAARHNALLQYLSMQPSERDAVNGNAIDCDTVACAAITDVTDYEQILSSPNNILGIEYCKALLKLNSSITPYTIRREGGGYNDDTLSAVNSSALAIRTALSSKDNLPTARSLSADRSDASSWQASLALSYASSWQASLASIREQMPFPLMNFLGAFTEKVHLLQHRIYPFCCTISFCYMNRKVIQSSMMCRRRFPTGLSTICAPTKTLTVSVSY